jgi:serine/threonine protein kinase
LELNFNKISSPQQEYIYYKVKHPDIINTPPPPPACGKGIDEEDVNYVIDCYKTELAILTNLKNHPNIVQIIDNPLLDMVLNMEMKVAIIMEQMEMNLDEWFRLYKPKEISEIDINKIAYQLLNGICAIHEINCAHLDIKAQNILIDSKTLQLKICDFGNSTSEMPTDFNIVTWTCRPIDVFNKTPFLDFNQVKLVDIWSAGCVLYQLVYNELFFNLEKQHSDKKMIKYGTKRLLKLSFQDNDVLKYMLCERNCRKDAKYILNLLNT